MLKFDTNGEDDVILIDTRADRIVRRDVNTIVEVTMLAAAALLFLAALCLWS